MILGNYTDKYWKAKELFEKFHKERNTPQIAIPKPPEVEKAKHYGVVKVHDYLSLEDLLNKIKPITSEKPKYMELLDIGPNYGQHFGFILYRTSINKIKNLKLASNQKQQSLMKFESISDILLYLRRSFRSRYCID